VIGTVAALRAEKNLSRLLRAFALVDAPCRLVVVGDGAERSALEALAAALGIAARVDFLGHQTEPSRFYRDFDIFALSSDTEQMPIALLEAMASSLPVVSTGVGDVRAMLPQEQAPFVVALDAECGARFAAALGQLSADAELRARLGAANRARVEREFALEGMVHRYGDLYRSLIAGGAAR